MVYFHGRCLLWELLEHDMRARSFTAGLNEWASGWLTVWLADSSRFASSWGAPRRVVERDIRPLASRRGGLRDLTTSEHLRPVGCDWQPLSCGTKHCEKREAASVGWNDEEKVSRLQGLSLQITKSFENPDTYGWDKEFKFTTPCWSCRCWVDGRCEDVHIQLWSVMLEEERPAGVFRVCCRSTV